MKTLLLILVFTVAAYAQRGGAQGPHGGQQPHGSAPMSQPQRMEGRGFEQHNFEHPRFAEPEHVARPFPVFPGRPPIFRRPIVIENRPFFFGNMFYGGFGWDYYWNLGFWPYYQPYTPQPQFTPCKKEKMKDSFGKKHDVLVCVQPDGSYKVVADANSLTPVDAK